MKSEIYNKTLYDFQKKAFDKLLNQKRILLFLDMGLGKTITSLALLEEFIANRKEDYPSLIICPKSQIQYWVDNIKKHLPHLKPYGINRSLKSFLKLKSFNPTNQDVYVTTYSRTGDPLLWDLIHPRSEIIIDEIQNAKNHTGKAGKSIRNLSLMNKSHIVYLSGDPISNHYQDLFNLLKMTELWNSNYQGFLNAFFNWEVVKHLGTSVRYNKIYGPLKGAVEQMKGLMATNAVWMKTEEAWDLPEFRFVDIELEGDEKVFKQIIKDGVVDDLKISSMMQKMQSSRQISSGFLEGASEEFVGEDTIIKPVSYSDEKLEAFTDLVRATDKKLVVFYNFVQELEQIKKAASLNKRDLFVINGSGNQKEKFIKTNNSIIAIQYQSGAEGVDGLQFETDTIIYYSPTLSGGLFKQSMKRVHRIGQTEKVTYYRFKTKWSIDSKIYKVIEQARDYTDELFAHDIEGDDMELSQSIRAVVQAESLRNAVDETYKEHKMYSTLKSMKMPELKSAIKSLGIIGAKSSDKKEDLIRIMIEADIASEQETKEPVYDGDISDVPGITETALVNNIIPEPAAKKTMYLVQFEPEEKYSHSKIDTYLKNPREFKHKYIDKLYSMEKKNYFFFGTVYHMMIEFEDPAIVRQMATNDDSYDEHDKAEIIEKAIAMGTVALQTFTKLNGYNEVQFMVPIKEGSKVGFGGFIDMVYEKEDGTVGIGEWKTTGKLSSITDKLNFFTQANRYAMAFYLATGIKPVEFRARVVVKPRIKQHIKESLEDFKVRYRAYLDADIDKFFHEFVIPLDWDKVEDMWNGTLETINHIQNSTYFPINDSTANMYGQWDYGILYDPKVKNAEQFFKKGRG